MTLINSINNKTCNFAIQLFECPPVTPSARDRTQLNNLLTTLSFPNYNNCTYHIYISELIILKPRLIGAIFVCIFMVNCIPFVIKSVQINVTMLHNLSQNTQITFLGEKEQSNIKYEYIL